MELKNRDSAPDGAIRFRIIASDEEAHLRKPLSRHFTYGLLKASSLV